MVAASAVHNVMKSRRVMPGGIADVVVTIIALPYAKVALFQTLPRKIAAIGPTINLKSDMVIYKKSHNVTVVA